MTYLPLNHDRLGDYHHLWWESDPCNTDDWSWMLMPPEPGFRGYHLLRNAEAVLCAIAWDLTRGLSRWALTTFAAGRAPSWVQTSPGYIVHGGFGVPDKWARYDTPGIERQLYAWGGTPGPEQLTLNEWAQKVALPADLPIRPIPALVRAPRLEHMLTAMTGDVYYTADFVGLTSPDRAVMFGYKMDTVKGPLNADLLIENEILCHVVGSEDHGTTDSIDVLCHDHMVEVVLAAFAAMESRIEHALNTFDEAEDPEKWCRTVAILLGQAPDWTPDRALG